MSVCEIISSVRFQLARMNFSQSETSSLLRGGGGEGVNRKDPYFFSMKG